MLELEDMCVHACPPVCLRQVGRDFLPRGSDIVTRRPLVLQLVKRDVPASGQHGGGGKRKEVEGGSRAEVAEGHGGYGEAGYSFIPPAAC